MSTTEFVDYYELLGCSPESSLEAIEKLTQALAKTYQTKGDRRSYEELVETFQILKDPQKRAQYDNQYRSRESQVRLKVTPQNQSQDRPEVPLPKHPAPKSTTMTDTEERTKILSAFYVRRRNNMKNPGLATGTLAAEVGCHEKVIEFHLWYFLQKGWVQREESGLLSITAAGVDRIDEINLVLYQNGS